MSGNNNRTESGVGYIPCEECGAEIEYLCVDCERALCPLHYPNHQCDGSALGE